MIFKYLATEDKPAKRTIQKFLPQQYCLYDCWCALSIFHSLFRDLIAFYLLPRVSFGSPAPPSGWKIIIATQFPNIPVLWILYSFRTFLSYEVKINLSILLNVFSKDKKYPLQGAASPSICSRIHLETLVHHGEHAARLFLYWKTIRHLKFDWILYSVWVYTQNKLKAPVVRGSRAKFYQINSLTG